MRAWVAWMAWVPLAGLVLSGCGGKEPEVAEEPATPDPAVEDAHSDEVSAIIKTGKSAVEACGEAENAGGSPVVGKLQVTFVIGADGKVSSVTVDENKTGNEDFARCVTAVIQGWVFPPHPYGDTIEYTYPFQVSPSGE